MNKDEFLKGLFLLAQACEVKLDPRLAALYADVLSQYGWDRVGIVLRGFQIRAKKGLFPAIGEFSDKLDPPVSDKREAIEAANRIIEAVGTYGAYNFEAAKEHIGELGVLVVERFGGWPDLCKNLNAENMVGIRAQLRELGETMIYREKQGRREIPPALKDIVGELGQKMGTKKIKGGEK